VAPAALQLPPYSLEVVAVAAYCCCSDPEGGGGGDRARGTSMHLVADEWPTSCTASTYSHASTDVCVVSRTRCVRKLVRSQLTSSLPPHGVLSVPCHTRCIVPCSSMTSTRFTNPLAAAGLACSHTRTPSAKTKAPKSSVIVWAWVSLGLGAHEPAVNSAQAECVGAPVA